MLKKICLSTFVLTAIGCGGSGTPTTPTQASITAVVSPSPAVSTVCSPACIAVDGRLFQWRILGSMTIQETSGVGGSITSITETSFNPNFVINSADITQRSGTNHVPARGTLVVPLNILYGIVDNPSASRQHTFTFSIQFTDDKGNQITGNAQWVAN